MNLGEIKSSEKYMYLGARRAPYWQEYVCLGDKKDDGERQVKVVEYKFRRNKQRIETNTSNQEIKSKVPKKISVPRTYETTC
jgi:hypothetical protein